MEIINTSLNNRADIIINIIQIIMVNNMALKKQVIIKNHYLDIFPLFPIINFLFFFFLRLFIFF